MIYFSLIKLIRLGVRHKMLCFYILVNGLLACSLFTPATSNLIFLNFGGIFFLTSNISKGLFFFETIKCKLYECCQEPYLQFNLAKLERNLNNNLFGQPLVKNTLYTALKGHFNLKDPKKALVLSFHGSTGVGWYFKCDCIQNI